MAEVSSFAVLSNGALLAETKHLAANERGSTVALILALSEVDSRRLYLSEGHSCMFYYCTMALHLSESAAYRRIEVARVARVFPQILDALKRGGLNLTTALIIAPHLTPDNVDALIEAASFKRKEDVRLLIAALRPTPDVPAVVRKQPESRVIAVANGSEGALAAAQTDAATTPALPPPTTIGRTAPASPAVVAPLSATRYKIQFTADQETHETLRHAQALLRHQIPTGDIAAIVKKALTLLVADIERRKLGVVKHPRRATSRPPRAGSRLIPAAVRREVWTRAGGRCAQASVENIQLRCRAHNAHEAVVWFGQEALPHRGSA